MICDKYRGKNTGPQSVKIASVDLSRSNFSIVLFQLRRETFTAASVHPADVIFTPFTVYYAYVAI
jgi:hypothetical protein